MQPSSKTIFAAASVVAAALLILPAITPAQDRPGATPPTPGTAGLDPFRTFEQYDPQVPVTLAGTVSQVYWTNPHVRVDVAVRDASGKVITWAVLGYPPATLKRSGFLDGEVKVGDRVIIAGFKNKDGSNTAGGLEITLADGSKKSLGPKPQLLVSPVAAQSLPGTPNPNAKDDPFHTYEGPAAK